MQIMSGVLNKILLRNAICILNRLFSLPHVAHSDTYNEGGLSCHTSEKVYIDGGTGVAFAFCKLIPLTFAKPSVITFG